MVRGLPPPIDITTPAQNEAPEIRSTERRYRRPAWFASLFLHALVIALLIGFWGWETKEEPPPIEIAFIPGNGAAGAQGGNGGGGEEIGPTHEEAAEAAPDATSSPDASTPPSTAAETQPTPSPEPRTTEISQAEAVQAVAPIPEPQQPEPKPAADLPSSPPHKPTPPMRSAQRPPTPARTAPAPPTPEPPAPVQTVSASVPATVPGTPGAGAGAGGNVGSGTGIAGAGRGAIGTGDLSAIGDDYLDRLRRHIRRFMTYPQPAKQQKQQGEVIITAFLRRDGTVLDARIAQSSGFPLLDDAALKAVRDSSKVPPFPDTYPVTEGKIDLPFTFRLGFLDRAFN